MKNTQKAFVGVDPGQSGALAVIYDGGVAVQPYDEREYALLLRTFKNSGYKIHAVVEHVGAMPKQGVASTFKFGTNFGLIQGMMHALDIPFELVRPQKWKKEFSCTSDKNTSIAVAQRLFPNVNLKRTPKCSKPHDGICEALLMAEYCRRRCCNA